MKIPTTLTLLTLAAASSTFHDPFTTSPLRRDFLTCGQTYGGGSTICGDPTNSHFCYDPTLGDACCLLDNGYCKLGEFCAPVQGYCCHNGEDPETCATCLGFELPPPESESDTPSSILFPPTSAAKETSSTLPVSEELVSATPIAVSEEETATSSFLASEKIAPLTSTVEIAIALATDASSTTVTEEEAVSTTVTGMMPEFTAPLNQTGGSGNGSVTGTGMGSNGTMTEFTGGAGERSGVIGVLVLVVGLVGDGLL